MAIIDLPNTAAFKTAQLRLGLSVSESVFTGALTGNRQRRSNGADRLLATLLMPPVADRLAGADREALLLGMRSAGDWLRMPMPHRPLPQGNLGGTLTVATTTAAGARSVPLAGGRTRPNLLQGGGFELDTNADNLANGWSFFGFGSTGTVGVTRVAGNGSTWAQGVFAPSVGSSNSDGIGIFQLGIPVVAGLPYTLACDTKDTVCTVSLEINWFNASNTFISQSGSLLPFSGGTWTRRTLTATAPAGAATAQVYISGRAQSGGPTNCALNVDNAQFEQAAAATTYAGLPTLRGGDFLASGGNLLLVAYGGITGNDDGTLTVPLALPCPKQLVAGATVLWQQPTGVWELDDDNLQLDYTAPVLQGGVAVPLRQVVL